MTKGVPRDPRKEQRWRQRLEAWRTSGLSVRAFCARHGLTEPSFYAWRRELERREREAPALVPVCVLAEEEPASQGPVEIVLREGPTVRVSPGFDAATLRRVLAVLGETRPC